MKKPKLKLLISQTDIEKAICEKAKEISARYVGKELMVIAIMNGALYFTTDLTRKLTIPFQLETIRASSYKEGFSSGELFFYGLECINPKGKDILIVDDVFDTGKTITQLKQILLNQGADSVGFCTLVRKESSPSDKNSALFTTKDLFLVGYGMDFQYHYRALQGIYVYEGDEE